MELPFAGLHQLCAPLLEARRTAGTPAERSRASRSASAGMRPTGSWSALGALTLLSEAAEEEPLLCLIDDAQWLDGASRQVLGFVARRLLAEPVAIVFAIREPCSDADLVGLPELQLGGLDRRATPDALLADVIAGRIDRARPRSDRRRDAREPTRPPRAPRGLSAAQLAGGFGFPTWRRSRARSSRASCDSSRSCHPRPGAAAHRRGRADRRHRALWRAAAELEIPVTL